MSFVNFKQKHAALTKGIYGGKDAEVLLLTKAVSSNPAAALPIIGGDGKSLDVLALTVATGITLTVDGFVKDPGGDVHEVTGAVSNSFDVVDPGADMVQAMDAAGNPLFLQNPDGTPQLDPATGQPVPHMVPAEAQLTVSVAA